VAQQELYMFYYELYGKFEDSTFYDFNVIESLTNTNLFVEYFFNLNGGEDYFAFFLLAISTYLLYK
jgi:hypothetical protein